MEESWRRVNVICDTVKPTKQKHSATLESICDGCCRARLLGKAREKNAELCCLSVAKGGTDASPGKYFFCLSIQVHFWELLESDF